MSHSPSRFLRVLVGFVLVAPLFAQQDLAGAPRIEQALGRLNVTGSVLLIAAHPDDENNPVLAYLSRGRHLRTAYLSATRGEGGQNLIGPEQGDQLGIIRTQELLAARAVDGGEQFFTRAIDFGFSKSADESLSKWGREKILSDMVWVIRRFRPDVIVTSFSGTPRDGHGQHQASAILAKEAFQAAGDAGRFPEQLRWVKPWQPKRALQSLFFPSMAAPNAVRLEIDTGTFDPILGRSYTEIGAISRSMHRCQGEGSPQRKGSIKYYLVPTVGDPPAHDLMDGIDTTWKRLPGGEAVGALIAEAIQHFVPARPDRIVPVLAKARTLLAAIDDPLAKIKLEEMDETIALCAGLWIDAQAARAEVVPGAKLGVTVSFLNRSPLPAKVESAALEGMWSAPLATPTQDLANNQIVRLESSQQVPENQPYSQPYWLAEPHQGEAYTVADQQLIGLPQAPAVVRLRTRVRVADAVLELVRPVHYRYVDRSEGERTRPLVVVPPVAVMQPEEIVLFPAAAQRQVHVAVKANVANAAGELRLEAGKGWQVEPASRPFQIAEAGEQQELTFQVTPPAGETIGRLRAEASYQGRQVTVGMHVILYPHIPAQTLFPEADGKLVRSDIRVNARRVGYIMGAGDEMPESLRQLGCEVTLLSRSDLEQRNLSEFDAIVAGVRAYNVRPDLHANQPRLLDYVRNGGTYIVQYNRNDDLPPIGPYPITISRDRVVTEGAPVSFSNPDSPLLKTPNVISAKDFEGWVQERGLYFASQWDPRYQPVLESHDPGDKALSGGMLWTRLGKGVYIFTAYAWFRQLPAGVPGAYRVFANLLSAK